MAREQVGIGGKIRSARERRGWSQFELSMRSGIAPSELSKYEKGHYEPNLPNYFRLCKVFGWPVPPWWEKPEWLEADSSRGGSSLNPCNAYTLSDLQVLWPEGFGVERKTLSAV
jgi:transcriptional regulator with XRE-family HTH domain